MDATANTIVFDIDGTLANIEHRLSFIQCPPKNWEAFAAGIPLDEPIDEIILINRMIATARAVPNETWVEIVLCSGRSEDSREATEGWLEAFGIAYDMLYMRSSGDYRQDFIVKDELRRRMIREGFNPILVFDDRQQVVDMWRAAGIRVAQVAPGKF